MAALTRDSLTQSINFLLAEVEKLPDNVFEDTVRRQAIRQSIIHLKNDIATPFERAFEEIFPQVLSHQAFSLWHKPDLETKPHQTTAVKIAVEGRWFEVLADGLPKSAQDIASATGAEAMLIGQHLEWLLSVLAKRVM